MKLLLPVLILCAGLSGPTPAAVLPAEKLLPSDTLFVLGAPDWSQIRTFYAKSPHSQLWSDPALKAFKDKFMGKLKSDVIVPLERELGLKFDDYKELAQGQLTFAVTRNGWEGKPDKSPGLLLLLDSKGKSDQLKKQLADLKKKWVDSGKQIKTDKIHGVEFTTLVISTDDISRTFEKIFPDPTEGFESLDGPKRKKNAKNMELLVGQSESLLILGTAAGDIEKILIRQSGGLVPTLSEHATYEANHNALFRNALVFAWLNAQTLVETFTKQLAAEGDKRQRNPGQPQADKLMAALGLNGVKSGALALSDAGEGSVAQLFIGVPEAARKGLFKMLVLEAKDAHPPPFVPAEAVKFQRWRLDLQKTWSALEAMLTDIYPPTAGAIKLVFENAGKDKDPNFDLRKSLIGNLGDDMITYQKAPRDSTFAELNSPPTLFLVSSANAEQLANAVKMISSLLPPAAGGAKPKEREFLGRKIYSLPLPARRGPDGNPLREERSLQYAASGGYVAMSADTALLEEYLRSGDSKPKSLRESPGLSDAAQNVGGMSTGLFGYENQNETMRVVLEALKKDSGAFANVLSLTPLGGRLGLAEDNKAFKEWFDFSLLPAFDKIAKYFYLTVYAGSITADGLNFKVFTPVPPLLRK